MSQELNRQAIAEAWDRIARTADGLVAYRGLQKTLCAVCTDLPALNLHEGRRHHASELMGLMSQGIETHDRTDAVVVFSLAGRKRRDEPEREPLPAGYRRRIRPDHYIAGFSDADTLAVSDPDKPA